MLQGIDSEKDMICVASGRTIPKGKDGKFTAQTLRCKRCRHHMIVGELRVQGGKQSSAQRTTCPLCHAQLPQVKSGGS